MTIGKQCHNTKPAAGTVERGYGFSGYVTRERMLTFWYQLSEVLALEPAEVLEVGIGPKVSSGVLRERGVELTTADIDAGLVPDHVVAVQDLDTKFAEDSFDVVLCARVLHHVPFSEFDACMRQLWKVARRYVVLTLPVDDLRLYASFRVTSSRCRLVCLPVPRAVKRAVLRLLPRHRDSDYRRLWKIDSSRETSMEAITRAVSAYFTVEKRYTLPEDHGHCMFVLAKNRGGARQ